MMDVHFERVSSELVEETNYLVLKGKLKCQFNNLVMLWNRNLSVRFYNKHAKVCRQGILFTVLANNDVAWFWSGSLCSNGDTRSGFFFESQVIMTGLTFLIPYTSTSWMAQHWSWRPTLMSFQTISLNELIGTMKCLKQHLKKSAVFDFCDLLCSLSWFTVSLFLYFLLCYQNQ